MKATLQVINQMRADGVIGQYAIGGAIGATFYLEPTATFDIDVFVSLKNAPRSSLISLAPIYDYLTKPPHYCKIENEYVIIAGWQVQFLPPGDALSEEALAQAIETDVDGVKTRVMTAEHLVAIALKLGRAKDKIRITQFLESGVLDDGQLAQIFSRHGLLAKWQEFKDKYGNE
jgi:hypothetical protein